MSKYEIRFSVRNQSGFRSATWKCFSPKGKDDVYLACREFNGAMKVSFHESGKWHIAFDRDFLKKKAPVDSHLLKNRRTSEWTEPKEICPGVIIAIRIVVPENALDTPMRNVHKAIVWIPAPPIGKTIEILIFITQPEAKVSSWPGAKKSGTTLVGKIEFASGKRVWVVYRVVDFTPPNLPEKGSATFFADSAGAKEITGPGLRAIITMVDKDGSRYLLETPVKRITRTGEDARKD